MRANPFWTATVVLIACLTGHGQTGKETRRHVVLPDPKMIRCISSDCYQLWLNGPPQSGDIYPERVVLSLLGKHCPYGVSAIYDKSISFDDLQAALEEHYGKGETKHWTKAALMIWHVGSGDFSIMLDTADKRISKVRGVDVGTKELFYTDSRIDTNTCNSK